MKWQFLLLFEIIIKPAVAVRKSTSVNLQKNFLIIKPLTVGGMVTKIGQKLFTHKQIVLAKFILKMQQKLNCLIGLAVMMVFAHVATANCKLQRIQRETCF